MDGGKGQGGSGQDMLGNYKIGEIIGNGTFAKVKVAKHKLTGQKVAIKIIEKHKIVEWKMEDQVKLEIGLQRSLVHPHIIRLYEVIETPTAMNIVMEYSQHGELFYYIGEKGRLHEEEARNFFQQIIAGVEYCHQNMVAHRYLKPENLLLDAKYNVKIADFGVSCIVEEGHLLDEFCGTINYASPEKKYAGPDVDVWSCGVILYVLLCGRLPFEDDGNLPSLWRIMKSGTYTLPHHLSTAARDLIQRMLEFDREERITIPEIRQHPWFQIHLPNYLAVPPPHSAQQIYKEILQEVVELGFDRNYVVNSLHQKADNQGTVTYKLLLDSRFHASPGYPDTEFLESMECVPTEPIVSAFVEDPPQIDITMIDPSTQNPAFVQGTLQIQNIMMVPSIQYPAIFVPHIMMDPSTQFSALMQGLPQNGYFMVNPSIQYPAILVQGSPQFEQMMMYPAIMQGLPQIGYNMIDPSTQFPADRPPDWFGLPLMMDPSTHTQMISNFLGQSGVQPQEIMMQPENELCNTDLCL